MMDVISMIGAHKQHPSTDDLNLPEVVQLVLRDMIIISSSMGIGSIVVVVLEVVDRGLEQVYQSEGAQ